MSRDAVGSVWGRLAGTEGGRAFVTGSHVDSQTPGGRFDGVLGVIGGVIALRTLRETFGAPRRPVEVVSLCEEEGSRFTEASFWGSRAITGQIGPAFETHALGLTNRCGRFRNGAPTAKWRSRAGTAVFRPALRG